MDKSSLIAQVAESEMLQFLGVKVEVATADRVVLTMEVTPKVHQYVGIMNGGISLYLCETAASIGVVAGADLTKVTPVGIEINALVSVGNQQPRIDSLLIIFRVVFIRIFIA